MNSRVSLTSRRLALAATALCMSGCVDFFEGLNPPNPCDPLEAQSLALNETTRVGFSGADLVDAIAGVTEFQVEWEAGGEDSAGLEVTVSGDARLSFLASTNGAVQCDSELSEAQLPVAATFWVAGQARSLTGLARPLLSDGKLAWSSFTSEPFAWQAPGPNLGVLVRLKLRASTPVAPELGDPVGDLRRVDESCTDGGETGGFCEEPVIATLRMR